MAFKLAGFDNPYVHSNYYLFSRQLKDNYINVENSWETSKMDQQITILRQLSKDLRKEAFDFLGTDTPKAAMEKIRNKDAIMSQIGRDVLTTPGTRQVLLSSAYSKDWVKKQARLEDDVAQAVLENMDEIVSEKELVDLLVEAIFTEDFSKKTGKQQKEALAAAFNIGAKEQKVQQAFDALFSKRVSKLRSSNGKLKQHIKKILRELAPGDAKNKEKFLQYFEKKVRKLASSGIYDVNGQDTVETYLKNFRQIFTSDPKIKEFYTPTEASRALGEEIEVSAWNADSNSFIIGVATGTMKETEIREKLMPSLETAATWNDPTKFSYTDIILENKNSKRVRAQSKNYVGAYETFIQTDKNIYQHTYLFGEEMLFKDFFNKLKTEYGGKANLFGNYDPDWLAYIVANEAWFDERGSYDKGSHSGWRQDDQGDTRIFGSDSWLSRALSGALINFLGIVISEDQRVITDLSNVFFLIDNKALVPTYVLIDDVISYYETGKAELANIRVTMKNRSASYEFNDKKSFYAAKAEAAGGILGEAIYEDSGLVGIGKKQGAKIMESLRIKSVNLGIDLEKLLTSSWVF